jgi:hypothetical protein
MTKPLVNLKIEADESWRALMWGAYVTHNPKPNFNKYTTGITLFPIAGFKSQDSLPVRSSAFQLPCFCNICKGPKT